MTDRLNIHQLPFNFAHQPFMSKEDFIVSPCNAEAFQMMEMWPDWPVFGLCIYGPEHCGKTHLANIFAQNVAIKTNFPYPIPYLDAADIDVDMAPKLFELNRCLVVENLCENINEEALFHLFNWYRDEGGFILFTSHMAPARLNIKLRDLSSRLRMLPAIAIDEPDDELLSSLIIKLFNDRQILISPEVVNYILLNMHRSFDYAHKLVEEIDNISLSYKRAVSIPIVKEAIQSLEQKHQRELF